MTEIGKKYRKAFVNLSLAVFIIWVSIFVAPKIILLFMPFVFGWVLAMLANPLVRFLEEKMKIKRKAGSALVILVVVAGLSFVVYAVGAKLVKEAAKLGEVLPQIYHTAEIEFISMKEKWSDVLDGIPEGIMVRMGEVAKTVEREMSAIVGELSLPTVGAVGEFAQNLPGIIIAVIMCLLSAYFFVSEKDYLTNLVKKYFSGSCCNKFILLKKTTVDVMVGYLKAQFKIEIWVYLSIVIGFWILKVRYGYLIAVLIAFLDILPVLGTGTILIPWAIFKALSGQYMFAVGLLIIWGVGQLIRQIIQPKVIGDSMGMSPMLTLVLLYAGYKLAGVTGMIVAVPLGMIVLAMNEAGFFDNSKKSLIILWNGLQNYRKYGEENSREIFMQNTEEEVE